MATDLSQLRGKYIDDEAELYTKCSAKKDPFGIFDSWLRKACDSKLIEEPNAVALATATKNGIPSCRMVLLKSFDQHGFRFFTNMESRKGRDLEENPHAAMTFYWEAIHRQVRIEGPVETLPEADSDAYFSARPRASQISASVSQQSRTTPSREALLEAYQKAELQFADAVIPRPKHWGGYVVVPLRIEFWIGHTNRLHERVLFERQNVGDEWSLHILQP